MRKFAYRRGSISVYAFNKHILVLQPLENVWLTCGQMLRIDGPIRTIVVPIVRVLCPTVAGRAAKIVLSCANAEQPAMHVATNYSMLAPMFRQYMQLMYQFNFPEASSLCCKNNGDIPLQNDFGCDMK